MAVFYGYTNAIFGTQSTVNGSAFDYNFAPANGSTWAYSGDDTYFVVEENDGATLFNGDPTNESVSTNEQVGGTWQQMTDIGGTDTALIWDYTFTVTDGTTTWEVGVIDVDLNDDNTLGTGEDGYFLIFPDGMPPPNTNLTAGPIVDNSASIDHASLGAEVVCFAAGTKIDTPRGAVAVETLRAGDLVMTQSSGPQPVVWSGQTTVAAYGKLAPVVIAAGTFENTCDVVVSPQHAILIDDWRAELYFGVEEILVRAIDLVGLEGVSQREGGLITYCHIMLDQHEIVSTEGLQSESLYPGDAALSALHPEARREILALFPELETDPSAYGSKAAQYARAHEAVCLAHAA